MENKQKTMTLGELKAALDKLTPEQLAMPVLWAAEDRGGKIGEVWILEEDHINPSGDGIEPASTYAAEEIEGERVWPAGTVILCDSDCSG